jgi:hypothetical protein
MFYHGSLGMLAVLSGLALAPTSEKPRPQPINSDACVLEYQRADNMWAAFGRPDGGLGTETISVSPGATKYFNTDWGNERLRNDGTHYYGSHLRIATNTGSRQVVLRIRTPVWFGEVSLLPGQSQQFQHDLTWVRCP